MGGEKFHHDKATEGEEKKEQPQTEVGSERKLSCWLLAFVKVSSSSLLLAYLLLLLP